MTSLLLPLASMRSFVAPTIIFGVTPHYYLASLTWRLMKSVVPANLYEYVDNLMYHSYQAMVVYFYECFSGTQVFFYGDPLPVEQENVIYISNHQAAIDWIVSDLVAVRQHTLGLLRYVMKQFFMYVPWYGPYFVQRSCIFVKREGRDTEEKIRRDLQNMKKSSGQGFWLVIFPEGTRYIPESQAAIEKSRRVAASKGLIPYKNVLLPKTKAFQLAVQELRPSLDAVYDLTIGFRIPWLSDLPRRQGPGILQYLALYGQELHIHVKRIPIGDIPEDEAGIKSWMYRSFLHKDMMMGAFLREDSLGVFPGPRYRMPLSRRLIDPYVAFYSCLLLATVATRQGRSLYWKASLASFASVIFAPLFYKIFL